MKYERSITLPILRNKLNKIEHYNELKEFIEKYPNATKIKIKQYRDYGIFTRNIEIPTDILSDILEELIERETKEIEKLIGVKK